MPDSWYSAAATATATLVSAVMNEGGASYADNLKDGEQLSSAITQLCEALERLKWWVHTRRGNRLRYWCSCHKQHSIWIEMFPTSSTYAVDASESLAHRTCYNREES